MLIRKKLLFCYLLFTFSLVAQADPAATAQSLAEKSYDQGNFGTSIAQYLELASLENGHVFYNLGNAHFKNGEKGKSIAAYLKARRLLPRDPDVRANLAFVQRSTKDRLESNFNRPKWSYLFLGWDHLSSRESYLLGMLLLCLGFMGLGLWFIIVKNRGIVIGGAVSLLLLGGYFSSGGYLLQSSAATWGAITKDSVKVRATPSLMSEITLFELQEGAPVALKGTTEEWVNIELFDRKQGWVQKSEVKFYGRTTFTRRNPPTSKIIKATVSLLKCWSIIFFAGSPTTRKIAATAKNRSPRERMDAKIKTATFT